MFKILPKWNKITPNLVTLGANSYIAILSQCLTQIFFGELIFATRLTVAHLRRILKNQFVKRFGHRSSEAIGGRGPEEDEDERKCGKDKTAKKFCTFFRRQHSTILVQHFDLNAFAASATAAFATFILTFLILPYIDRFKIYLDDSISVT